MILLLLFCSLSHSDDPVLSVLHLWPDRRNPELPVCASAGEAPWRSAFVAHGCHVSGLPGDQQLHTFHVADVQAGQQRAAAYVSGAWALAASLARDGWEGRGGTEERRAESRGFSVSQCRLALVFSEIPSLTPSGKLYLVHFRLSDLSLIVLLSLFFPNRK